MSDPSVEAWDAALNVLSYLNTARALGVNFDGDSANVVAFSDSSWNQSPRPYGGHVIFFAGAIVSCCARKLKIAPQSSAEAENAVYSICCKDLIFICNILGDDGMQLKIPKPIKIFCDNEAAVKTIKNIGATARNKHYERWIHYGREQYLNKFSLPLWISTKLNVADIFTKALDSTTFYKFRAALLNISYEHLPMELSDKIHVA